jgi:hypothetical protein
MEREWGVAVEAFYNVVFPPHEETRVRVHSLSNHICISGFPNGTPMFTVTIGNYRIDDRAVVRRSTEGLLIPFLEVEREWIMDIVFTRSIQDVLRTQYGSTGISFVSILAREGSLSNGYFTMQKTDGNTWEIEFTSRFVEENREMLPFEIVSEFWGWTDEDGLHFNLEEAITPYKHIFITNRQLRVLRNAVFARHGFVFRDQGLERLFVTWHSFNLPRFPDLGFRYQPNPNFHAGMLTDIDRANIAIIQRLEALVGE